MNVETTELGYHRAGVDLAHVTISVGFLQLTNVQTPRAVDDFLRRLAAASRHPAVIAAGRAGGPGASAALVGNRDTRIVRNRPHMDREYRLVRGAQPADLENANANYKQLCAISPPSLLSSTNIGPRASSNAKRASSSPSFSRWLRHAEPRYTLRPRP